MPQKPHWEIIVILFLGLVYLLVLQSLVPDDIFFSGDSGLKAMLSQNMAEGPLRFDLDLSGPSWAKTLWDQGLFPYARPFVYQFGDKYFITFPYTFSLLTAPFYALFGYRGFYFVPLLATLLVWIVFYLFCKKMELNRPFIAIGLFTLVFTTNLSLYSAMYWEHTLAVGLSFAGLFLIFPARTMPQISRWAAAGAGGLTGLAVWFRPEHILLVLFLAVLAVGVVITGLWGNHIVRFKQLGNFGVQGAVAFLISSLATLLLFGFTNWLIYQNFFGIHAIQVLESQSLVRRWMAFINNLILLTVDRPSVFVHVPIVLFPLLYLILSWVRLKFVKVEWKWYFFYGLMLVFFLGVCAMVPDGAGGKQWGPRFLLFLTPVMVLLFTDLFNTVWISSGKSIQRMSLSFVLVLLCWGLFHNLFQGSVYLARTYTEIKIVADELRAQARPVIAISDQYLGQMFQPALSQDKIFFRVIDKAQLTLLTAGLVAQNQDQFTYICYTVDCDLLSEFESEKQFEAGVEYNLYIVRRSIFEKYTILDIEVRREN